MKPLVIFGIGSLAKTLYYYVTEYDQREVLGFTVESKYMVDNTYRNLSVFPFERILEYVNPDECEVLLAIGYTNMNREKGRIFHCCKETGFQVASFIHPTAHISKSSIVGEGTVMLEDVVISAHCNIGVGNMFWNRVNISHDALIGDFNNLAPGFSTAGEVKIGSYCFGGVNATLQNNVIISDFTLIGGGSYVSHDTKSYDVIVPVRSITLEGKRSTDFM